MVRQFKYFCSLKQEFQNGIRSNTMVNGADQQQANDPGDK